VLRRRWRRRLGLSGRFLVSVSYSVKLEMYTSCIYPFQIGVVIYRNREIRVNNKDRVYIAWV
jgi:hypothetical protein